MILRKIFLSWWIIQFFENYLGNFRKYRDIKLVTTERKGNYLVSELNYHNAKFFKQNVLAVEMIRTQIVINKHFFLSLLILDLSKSVMY